MPDLNASISNNGRIIPKNSDYDSIENRGIRTHNKFGKFFAEFFGSGTVTVNIDSKTYYLNRGSCYALLKLDKNIGAASRKSDLIMQLILHFDSAVKKENNEDPINLYISDSENKSDHSITPLAPALQTEQNNKLNNMNTWANDNCAKLGSDTYSDLMSVIKFFKFINTDSCLNTMKVDGCYWFPDLEVVGIPFHEDESWEKTKKNLMKLSEEFIGAFYQLNSEQHKIEFSKNLNGACIEGRTNAALIYASNIIQNPHIESFFTLIERCRLEAYEALKNQKLSIKLLTDHIMRFHGGEICIPDEQNCPEGILSRYYVRCYLEFAEVDMD